MYINKNFVSYFFKFFKLCSPEMKSFCSRSMRVARLQGSKRKRYPKIALASRLRLNCLSILAWKLYSNRPCYFEIARKREREREKEKAREKRDRMVGRKRKRVVRSTVVVGRQDRGRSEWRERKRESSLSSEKSRESNESGATGVFATNIYITPPPPLVCHPFCNSPPSLAPPSPRDTAERCNYVFAANALNCISKNYFV